MYTHPYSHLFFDGRVLMPTVLSPQVSRRQAADDEVSQAWTASCIAHVCCMISYEIRWLWVKTLAPSEHQNRW